jgi:hypothetical protein
MAPLQAAFPGWAPPAARDQLMETAQQKASEAADDTRSQLQG